MAHIDEGTLQAYLDDEVGARAEIDEHLAACTECAAELAKVRAVAQLFATAMHSVDTKAPTHAALAEVSARRLHSQPLRVPQQPRTFARVPLARAAMLVIGLAAAASAAIPGSPVRALISNALRIVTGDADQDTAPAPRPAPASDDPVFDSRTDESAALSIQPVQGRVRIVLTRVAPDATVQVRLIDSDRATVQATGAAAHARFRTGPGRIEMVDVAAGEVTIDMPRSAFDARVTVDGRVIYPR